MAEIAWQPTDVDPKLTCETYDTLKAEWELNRDIAELHLATLRTGAYLDEFGGGHAEQKEAKAQYEWRKAASLALDQSADLVGLRVDNIFRAPPVRDFHKSPYKKHIEQFLPDVDGAGTHMNEFMRRHLPLYYINGVDFVVDKQDGEGTTPTTLMQERELGMRAYVHAFSPLKRVDWSVDSAGRFLWARYNLGTPPPLDEADEVGEIVEYLTVTPYEWRLYQTGAKDGSARVQIGPHTLGQCPIVPFYYAESSVEEYVGVPISLMTRIAPIARYLINLVSQIQIDILRNICFLVATGVEADKIPKAIATMGCWALPDGAEIHEQSGDVAHIVQKVAFAEALMLAILRLGKLTGATGDMQAKAASGVQVAVERTSLDNELKATAGQLETVETEIVRMAISRQLGKPITTDELGYSVRYNKRFVLTDTSALISEAKLYFDMPGVSQTIPTLSRKMVERIADAIVRQGDPAHDDILAELEAAEWDPMGPPAAPGEDEETQEDANGGTPWGVTNEEESDEERALQSGVK